MQTHHVERTGQVDLVFEGELLSEVSTQSGRKTRWTVLRIYKTATGKWVVEHIGESSRQGEKVRRRVTVTEDPLEVRKAVGIERKDGDGEPVITFAALDALDEAVEKDPTLAPAAEERI